jgi:hypothetical protein
MSLLEPHNLPFLIALGVLAVVALGQLAGLSDAIEGVGDIDAADGLSAGGFGEAVASLLGLGRVPLLVWFACLSFVFAATGVIGQAVLASLLGSPLPAGLAALAAGGAALPLNSIAVRPLGAIMPRDETTAVSLDDLVRREAIIQIGSARRGSPARAKVLDAFGQPHFVMVEPQDDAAELAEGETVLLVRRDSGVFFAIQYESPLLGIG